MFRQLSLQFLLLHQGDAHGLQQPEHGHVPQQVGPPQGRRQDQPQHEQQPDPERHLRCGPVQEKSGQRSGALQEHHKTIFVTQHDQDFPSGVSPTTVGGALS